MTEEDGEALEEAHRRELAFIAGCSDVHRLLGRMAAYKADRELARENGWKAHAIYAEHLLDAAAKRFTSLSDAGRAKDREAERLRARALQPARPLPPPARAPLPVVHPSPRNAPPMWSRPPPPRWTPPPQRPDPPRHIPQPLQAVPRQTEDDDDFREEPPKPPPPSRTAPPPAQPPPEAPAAPSPHESAPAPASSAPTAATVSPAAPATAPSPRLTGRDLAEFRARKGLTLREAATLLGSLSGTLSKAISAADRPLPEKLQIALRAALNG